MFGEVVEAQDTIGTLDAWRGESVAQWKDNRIVDAAWVDAVVWFFKHAYADLANFGLTCQGYSFRENYQGYLLVLKVMEGDVPYVVFVGSKDPTGCMSKLRKQLRNGGLSLKPDQYR